MTSISSTATLPAPACGALTRRLFGAARCVQILLVAVAALVTVSCETLPITGRKQFVNPFLTEEQEIELGKEAFRQALDAMEMSRDETKIARVRRIGGRLVEASGRSDLPWEFVVIQDDETLNAWALPGGKVGVYSGLLKLTEGSDAMLATVMGHELAHVTHRHGAERLTRELGANIVAAGLQLALQNREQETVNLVMGAYGLGSEFLVERPFSRDMEREADHVGLIYMARAGYDPEASIEFWKKMAAAAGPNEIPAFLSTHPSHEERVDNLRKWLPEVKKEFQPIE